MKEINADDFIESIRRVISIFDELGLQFHLTGGVVSTFYGEPRFTQDIDIVLVLDRLQAERLLARIDEGYYYSAEAIYDAVKRNSMFQLLDQKSMIKIDLHLGEGVPGELSRSKTINLFNRLPVRVVSIEDAIASKLLWIKKGSHRSRDDVKGMLQSDVSIDFHLLESLAADLKVLELLAELKRELSG